MGSWVIEAHLPVSFKIKNSPNIFSPSNNDLLECGSQGAGSRRLVIIDRNICKYYLADVEKYFMTNKVDIHIVAIDATEADKNLNTLLIILHEMENFGVLRRQEPIIAIGGGVLLDIVGLASGLYRRGVPYIRVPTTLVGLIDASVGVKTGINFDVRRNRLGGYYAPVAAYLDVAFLNTLPALEISSGFGEILKMAVIKDSILFSLLERNSMKFANKNFLDCEELDEILNRAVDGMVSELNDNLWEKDLKRVVDFGHTFSPTIEMRSIEDRAYKNLTHGQAVTLDVIFSSIISMRRNLLSRKDIIRIMSVARSLDLPTNHELFVDPLALIESLNDTQRHRDGNQNLPIPIGIGNYIFINDLSFEEIKLAANDLSNFNRSFGNGLIS